MIANYKLQSFFLLYLCGMKKIFFAAAVFTTLFTSCLKNDCSPILTIHERNQAAELQVYVNGHKHKLSKCETN